MDRGRAEFDEFHDMQRSKGLPVHLTDKTASVSPGAADMARFAQARVLVVDDSPANLALAKEMLALWGFHDVVGVTDATEAAGVIATRPPDLVLLDLHLPGLSGLDLMRHLDPLQSTTPIPVLVLTADGTMETKRQALAAKAHDFLVKPFDPEELRLRVSNLLEMRLLQLQLREQNEQLEQRVAERTRELERAKLEIADTLALAGEYRDDATHQHALRIGHTTEALGIALDLPEPALGQLRRAAALHDIGKIAIPDAILLKPGPLSVFELDTIKAHTVIGARILSGSESAMLPLAAEIALSHHERWDGSGYPRSLAGDLIPLVGRLVAVADAFDALTHDRPYKRAVSLDAAVREIMRSAGTHFDPQVTQAFAELDHAHLASPPPHELRGELTASDIARAARQPVHLKLRPELALISPSPIALGS
jgi:putative two-component system response regulator